MKRLLLLFLLSLGGLCVEGQTTSSITISTNPQGARFQVDGTTYASAVTFLWPQGSTHYVVFITDPPLPGAASSNVQTSLDGTTQYVLTGWEDNNQLVVPATSPIQTITANPAVTSFTATVNLNYRVNLTYYTQPSMSASPPTCGAPGAIPAGAFSPGVVYIGSQCYWSSVATFVTAGSSVSLNAYPYPGFAFEGWSINGARPTSFLTTMTVNGPTTVAPQFELAELVSFLTSPLGLQVLIDHSTVNTRTVNDVPNCPNNESIPVVPALGFPSVCFGDFYFAPGSTHYISGVTPQRDVSGNWWVFNQWSNGQPQDSMFTAGSSNTTAVLTANFIQGAQVGFVTSPAGLKLTIDGNPNYASYDFIWGVGTTHQVAAAATQTGSNGRTYTFQNWSNQGPASQSVTVASSMMNGGYLLTANYNELDRVVVQSIPSGLTLQANGSNCVTPCNVDLQSGATFQVTAPTQIAMGTGARLDFHNWSDGGASTHTVTVSQNFATITVAYNTMYQLSAASTPSNGSNFKYSPSSPDSFYAQGTQVSVTSVPNPGFKFGHWSGDLSGSYSSGTVTLTAPEGVMANMISVPYIAPAGILNGVGPTPSTSVAPGSLISIFGQNLASTVQVGPTNPLAQSLTGTTVTINGTFLPLTFVSPQQINAQLPSSLTDGNYTLEVETAGQQPISGNFTVARDAPGLFSSMAGSVSYAMAFHADGSMITTSSPAAAGETISFLGTGFGPYEQPVLDGFFPPNPPPAVSDSVDLTVGGQKASSSSTAAPGFTGVTTTQFQVPSGLSGSAVPLLVTINGIDSNTVMLPVK
jgi:uncharacterized protein (TIGR03437 family)